MKTSVRLLIAALVIAAAFIILHTGTYAQDEQPDRQKQQNKFRKSKKPVREQYIVVLNRETPAEEVEAVTNEFLGKHGGTARHIYKHALKGFSIELPEAAAMALSHDPRVEYVEEDTEATLLTSEPTTNWNLDRIDQRQGLSGSYYYPNVENGQGVHAYILDTGIRRLHREFSNADGSNNRTTTDADLVWWNNTGGEDCHGHGTAVAGVLGGRTFGVAKAVRLHGVRIADCSGGTNTSTLVAGIDWVTNTHIKPAVANISFGVHTDPAFGTALDEAIRASIAAGVTYVVAAGNNNTGNFQTLTPARIPEVITVGATNIFDARASFSNFGPGVDLFAPGEEIHSANNLDLNGDGIFQEATGPISGTSFSAPLVAGVVARFLKRIPPNAAPAAAVGALVHTATQNVITNPGSGSPNRLLFADLRHALLALTNLPVAESSVGIDTGFDVGPGQWLALSGSGLISSSLVTPPNGPQGWSWPESSSAFPLPGSRPYSLIGNLDGQHFYIGTSKATTESFPSPKRLFLRTNDALPGNGSGAFQSQIELWKGLPEARADFIDQFVPDTLLAGQTFQVWIKMQNVGPTAWTGSESFKLATLDDSMTWGLNRLPIDGSVQSGSYMVWIFDITAPTVPGSYNFQWRMLQEGVQRFGDATVNKSITVLAPSNQAQFISQSVPSTMTASETYTVSITMKNIGTTAWGAGSAYRLGSWNPHDNMTWGLNRVTLPHHVYPGQEVTLTFDVMAPTKTGNTSFQWRMVKEWVEWFGQPTDLKTVLVKPPSCPGC